MTTADEFKALLSTYNKGITSVEINEGVVVILTKSKKCVAGVMSDLNLSRAFRSITCGVTADRRSYFVNACPN